MFQKAALMAIMWMLLSVSAFTIRPNAAARGFRASLQQLGATKSLAEKVLENPKWPSEWPYSPEDFARMVCCWICVIPGNDCFM